MAERSAPETNRQVVVILCIEAVELKQQDAVVLGDLGCMLNIEGKLRRLGDERTQVLHIAEVLTGEA